MSINKNILRADDKVEIQFARYHTHVTGEDPHNPKFKQDLEKGIMEMKWYDATDICVRGCWGKVHYGWDRQDHYGAWARVCQERTGFHRCRMISEVIPKELEGQAVTFAGAVAFDIRGENSPNIIVNVHGAKTESTCMTMNIAKEYVRPEYDFHLTFHPIYFGLPNGTLIDGYEFVSGIMHFKVFPSMIRYGERMIFEFVTPVGYDENTLGLTIGILDSTQADIAALQKKNNITDVELQTRRELLAKGTQKLKQRKIDIAKILSTQASINIDCSKTRTGFDRGEKRVTMYPSWIGIGTPPDNAEVYAKKLTGILGTLDLFRYQGHIDHYDFSSEKFSMSDSDRKEWGNIHQKAKEVMFSGGPHHSFLTKLRNIPENKWADVVKNGIGDMTWARITDNFYQYIMEAKRICPAFSILQMPYELDNASDTDDSRDIHYSFYKCCYRAVVAVNKKLKSSQPLRVCGPSINTFNTGRWMGWMEGFLKRYAEDTDPQKQLDYLVYHCYFFPGALPKAPVGQHAHILRLLNKYGLNPATPIIIDESGIAEFSVLDEYKDLVEFSRKQLCSATWQLTLQHWYSEESDLFHPISGDGWHFGSLCIGKQGALTHRAKAMILRSKLDDILLNSEAQPKTGTEGYGVYSMATMGTKKISVLAWSCSPRTFLDGMLTVRYPSTQIRLKNLPKEMRGRSVKLSMFLLDMQNSNEEAILSQPEYAKIQKIDRQRYILDLSPEDVRQLDEIHSKTLRVEFPSEGDFFTTLEMEEHGIYLMVFEVLNELG